ncbi:hypothetical protein KAR91_28375 [Candidatus Pacearchaeota archaeon]|nr:hypothetical protein [Candidatus Pacearchaeota archaeon]
MNAEQLLKSISEILKNNEQFLIENPEIFSLIEGRLHKAIDYEDYQPEEEEDDEDFYNDSYDESGISDLFDNTPEEDIDEDMDGELSSDEADQWLKENEAEISQGSDSDSDGDVELPEEVQQQVKANDKPKVSASGYRDWSPKDKYEEQHQAAIDKHMSGGYSHREAERMAGAHEAPTDFHSALKHKIKPTQPSEKMLSHLKGLSGDWLRNAERKIGESAEAKRNPLKHASAKALTAHEDAHSDFKRSYDEFLGSDDVSGLKGRERHKAIKAFKEKWNSDNPSHREGAIAAAESGKAFGTAMEERKQHLEEGKQAILGAGKVGGEMTTASEFSSAAAGGTEGLTAQGAAQMAGGTQEEGGYTTGTVKDPAMVFAERNPEYVKSLQDKLGSKLSSEQSQRLKGIQGFKKKGNE